jgi:serine protease
MKRMLYSALALTSLVALLPLNGYAAPSADLHVGGLWRAVDADKDYVQGEIKIKFKDGTSGERVNAIHARYGVRILQDTPHYQRISVPNGVTVPDFADTYAKLPEIEWAVPNWLAHMNLVPNDPNYMPLQWDMPNIGMEQAWDLSTGAGIKVSLNDTGIAYENYTAGGKTYCKAPDLNGVNFDVADAYDFINNDAHPNDDNAHGTHTCGTLAEQTNNGMRSAGMAYGVTVVPIKVLDSGGSGPYSVVADGIRWAVDHGVQIIGMSLGGSSDDPDMRSAIQYAYQNRVLVICSAGNNYGGGITYPAKYSTVIAVTATGPTNQLAYYSSKGPEADLCAPGGDDRFDINGDGNPDYIWQEDFGNGQYCTFGTWGYEGTSMASPHVTAAAAMVWSAHPTWTPRQVVTALIATATDLGTPGKDTSFGRGKINVPAAINYSGSELPNAVNSTPSLAIASLNASPNPARGKALIQFRLAQASDAVLEIYGADGRLVNTLAQGHFDAASQTVQWNGRNAAGVAVPAGVYYAHLTAGDDVLNTRIVLQR